MIEDEDVQADAEARRENEWDESGGKDKATGRSHTYISSWRSIEARTYGTASYMAAPSARPVFALHCTYNRWPRCVLGATKRPFCEKWKLELDI